MPNYGGVEFGSGWTNWTAQSGTQIDYFVTVAGEGGATAAASVGTQIMNSYVDAVGQPHLLVHVVLDQQLIEDPWRDSGR